ncbi:D-hexose-6-phosphate mutarotase [Paraferrimonas sedimenticola]|uniref:Putative glucose-6-phosphate 1-epimerase n=1 Tax=Paraferrimonas sedimenticola TaxID=375674 RepID=A0AA37RWE2_9GAMM|nr:D-hexose-6-phosphate mutarotase [Paraferrimonas sedimenticola]GLP96561.1 D-hexose-6-phosphate mutarotase [Paraferrimonas sedimenticola]
MEAIRRLTHPQGLEYLLIDTPLCRAEVYLQGAQLASFTPKGAAPILWMSDSEHKKPGFGLRGGVPICWPWFGMHEQADHPQHGFARKLIWQLVDQQQRADGSVLLTLELPQSAMPSQFWPYQCKLEAQIELGRTAEVQLTTTNLDQLAFSITQALHSYFAINDIHNTRVHGLQGCHYLEFGEQKVDQQAFVEFDAETDRVYQGVPLQQKIECPNGTLVVERSNSRSCVLWNPWIAKAQRLDRFNDDGYLDMLCLEASNALDDAITIEPGQSHTLATRFGWE